MIPFLPPDEQRATATTAVALFAFQFYPAHTKTPHCPGALTLS